MSHPPLRGPILTFALLALAAGGGALAQTSDVRAEHAVELYNAGNYAAARALIEELDAEGLAGGALLYRLHYCLSRMRDRGAAGEVLTRSVEALEREIEAPTTLEVPFYLSNAYRNQQRMQDAAEVARRATERFERDGYPTPERPIEFFWVAKLYADQDAVDRAVEWFEKTLAAIEASGKDYLPNERWARRYLGDTAYSRGDFAAATAQFERLASMGDPDVGDLDKLATTNARAGRWNEAIEIWDRIVRVRPAVANRARYCSQLARQALEIGELPAVDEAGRGWAEIGNDELVAIMKAQATVAAEAAAWQESGSGADPGDLAARLGAARGRFVAAALEYAYRGLPIRETAFQGGFAPLIFHARRWKLEAS